MSRWLFRPPGRSVICLATGRSNLTRPGHDVRAGDVLETSDEDAARLSGSYPGVDGAPCLVPLDSPDPAPPSVGAEGQGEPDGDSAPEAGIRPAAPAEALAEAPAEAPAAAVPEAWADAWPEPPPGPQEDAGAIPDGALDQDGDGPPAVDPGPAEVAVAAVGDAPAVWPSAPAVDLVSVMARVEALHHNRRLAVARRLPGGGSVRRLDAALSMIGRALVTDPAAVEAAVSEVEAASAAGDRP